MTLSTLHSMTRRTLLALTCAAALAAPVLAQDQTPAPPPPQQQGPGYGNRGAEMQARQLEHLTRALNLSADQVTQVKAIQADSQQQMMAARQDSSTQGEDKRARMMSIRQAQDTKIRGLLTDEQKTKYDAMQAQMKERQEQRREQQGNGQAPPQQPPSA